MSDPVLCPACGAPMKLLRNDFQGRPIYAMECTGQACPYVTDDWRGSEAEAHEKAAYQPRIAMLLGLLLGAEHERARLARQLEVESMCTNALQDDKRELLQERAMMRRLLPHLLRHGPHVIEGAGGGFHRTLVCIHCGKPAFDATWREQPFQSDPAQHAPDCPWRLAAEYVQGLEAKP